jgi:hypothetical protein
MSAPENTPRRTREPWSEKHRRYINMTASRPHQTREADTGNIRPRATQRETYAQIVKVAATGWAGRSLNMLNRPTAQALFLIGLIAAATAMGAMLAACAPTYDNVADQMLVDTQKQADDGLTKLENLENEIDRLKKSTNSADKKALTDAEAQAGYASNIDFYSKLQSSTTALDDRITSNPDLSTQKIAPALKALEDNIESVRQTHATQNALSPDFAKLTRQQMDQQFKALTVYELTIKNGSKPQ